ncbi:MAG: glucosamine-6-phosphate deaminase [Syntrophomonadaceae bacterium]|jgi:glucosamine-6-phosphate deaminase|nr:glucosamine-6-phosphate deaminase [Syntrophomonadaceae bacterium]
MDIIIKDSYDQMSRCAAEIIASQVKSKPDCVLGLATGSTPIGTYKELIRLHREGLDFSRVKTFNLDEYLGLGMDLEKPYDLDQSYARFMYEELFKDINIKKENIYIPDGLSQDPEKYCSWYEEEIKKAGGIDLQLLGLGGNGHLGFNEPGSSFESKTRVEALTKQTLDDNYKAFYQKANIPRSQMPQFAITMGIGTILEARNILMIVNGSKKADIVAKCLESPIDSQIPATALRLHKGSTTVVLDKEAASKLKLTGATHQSV